jgi:hypothetical protein
MAKWFTPNKLIGLLDGSYELPPIRTMPAR